MRHRVSLITMIMLISFIGISCAPAPTYPREKVIEGIKDICKKEYGVDVDVKIVDTTLGVRMPLKGVFDPETFQPAPDALEKLDGVMLSVSRVALSSDKSFDFYTIITTDTAIPGTEIVITRYVGDLRRYVFGDISRGEFSNRMVFDVRFNPEGVLDVWLNEFTLREVRLQDFICKQAAHRIVSEFKDNKMLVGKFKISSCAGKLELGRFRFQVEITREGLPMSELIHGTAWHDKVLELCLQKIAHTLYIYDFNDFDDVEITNTFDNKLMQVNRADIKNWRKRPVTIE